MSARECGSVNHTDCFARRQPIHNNDHGMGLPRMTVVWMAEFVSGWMELMVCKVHKRDTY